MAIAVAAGSAPAGILSVTAPSSDRIDPPAGPIVAADGNVEDSAMIGVTTGSPEALSIEESKTSTLPEVTLTCIVASSGIAAAKRSWTFGCVQPKGPREPFAVPTVAPDAAFRVREYAAPSAPAAKPTFVRKAAFWRMPVTTAPASADIRKDSNERGFCCAPNVPGTTPNGSTLLVRQRTATGTSVRNRRAPADPTGRPRSESRTSTTSRIFPAGTVNVPVNGAGLEP